MALERCCVICIGTPTRPKVGLRVWPRGATPISRRWRWRTKTRASCGHCSSMGEITRRTSPSSSHRLDLKNLTESILTFSHSPTDCTGVFEVMAIQVKTGVDSTFLIHGTSKSDQMIRRQPAHSIRARGSMPHYEVECMAAIFYLQDRTEKALGITGASMYGSSSICESKRSSEPPRTR